jgi:uncharacterized protein (TIGR02453 family)
LSRFTGFPAEAFDFYDELAADPTKSWWEGHKDVYQSAVRGPLASMGDELAAEFGEPHLYRPYRDIRFSRDKTPYKDHQGMFVELRNGLGWYAQISAGGLMVAGGWYTSNPTQVARYRDAVAADPGARLLLALLGGLEQAGLEVDGDRLKSRPRGVPADHPHLDLLRYRTLYVHRQWSPASWMGNRAALTRVADQWRAMRPLLEWLSEVVGPGDTRHTTGSQGGL